MHVSGYSCHVEQQCHRSLTFYSRFCSFSYRTQLRRKKRRSCSGNPSLTLNTRWIVIRSPHSKVSSTNRTSPIRIIPRIRSPRVPRRRRRARRGGDPTCSRFVYRNTFLPPPPLLEKCLSAVIDKSN